MKCRDVKLHDFVVSLCEKDYSWISTDPVAGAEAFSLLHDEYNQLMNTGEHAYMLNVLSELAALKSRYIAVEAALLVLQQNYDQQCADVLTGFGYEFDQANYLRSMQTIYKKLKTTRLNIDRKIKEYEDAARKHVSKEATYQDFVRTLAVLSTSVGIPLQMHACTVSEFAAYYNIHVEKLKANGRPDR